jgi:hypothetical protein
MHVQIVRATGQSWPHDAFLFWYFHKNCLNSGKPSLVADMQRRIAKTGFDLASLGLLRRK